MFRHRAVFCPLVVVLGLLSVVSSRAVILWSDLGATLVHESGIGVDILGGALKRDDTASDTLYFKFHVDPLSDAKTEEYFAAFQLFEGETERLGVGNSMKAWAYSVFNTSTNGELNKVFGDLDLRSARPELSSPGVSLHYELPYHGIECTIVFKVQYIPGGDDLVTVWLNPDLAPGATEAGQPEELVTTFKANASFDQIHLRHGGGGGGWTFSDMAIATSFSDFVSAGDAAAPGARHGALAITFRSWQREQGLPQNSVHALAQTRDGYLWIGSDDGVVRFDGVRFVSFGLREGLRSGRVRVLFADSGGGLWIGTVGGGLTRWQEGRFTTFTLQDGLPDDSITALAEDNEQRVWVGTEAGLAVWLNDRPAPLSAAAEFKGKPVTTLFKDRHGVMWLGATGAGVYRYVDGKFVRLTDASLENLLLDPHCLLEDQAGRLWVGAGDDFVLCREGDEWRRYRIPRHLARPYVSALVEETDGTIWAGSVSEGLFQFKDSKLMPITASSGLSDNMVESLLVDHGGNLWVGTGSGLNQLRRKNLWVFGQNEGLGYGAVQGLAEVAPGVIWAAKPSDGLYRWEGRRFGRLAGSDLFRRYPEINCLLAARDGSCWVGATRGLLHFKEPRAPAPEADASALAGLNVIALAEGRNGELWAGTREGELWRLQSGAWTRQTIYSQAHAITAIVPDTNGVLWLGTEGGGLYRFEGSAREHFDKRNGLLSNLIRTLYLDSAGVLWVGTAGGGMSCWQQGRLTTFTTREGLPDNTISQILEDDLGRLWLGNNRGIGCVNKRDLEPLAVGAAVYPQVYGRAEGLLSEECTGGFCPAGLKTKSGRLWFSTLKGVVAVDPHPQSADAPAPTVLLEEALIDGTPADIRKLVFVPGTTDGSAKPSAGRSATPAVPSRASPSPHEAAAGSVPAGLRIPPGKHRLEFRYTVLSFNEPERVRFRYQLEGLDSGWVEAGPGRTAAYPYVPPGEYRFHVIACNSEGVWNEAGAALALTVLPHFWQAPWVLALAAMGLLVSASVSARVLEKRKHQRRLRHLEEANALERERARIAQDLHDDLGSSLTRVSLLSDLIKADKDSPAQVEVHAGKISQSAAVTVRALEEIVWALRPGSDTLQSLVEYIAHFANELFDGNTTRCRLDLPHDLPARPLPPEMRHNIFLIVKEALTNALKHASAQEVRVQAKATARSLEIVVQDDGQGFDAEATPVPGKRHGLGNMRRRAEAMGGTLTVESGRGKGTTVRLDVRFAA
jgi:ligand-binding sensor domain-containing protein/signal transduction histidine kinase